VLISHLESPFQNQQAIAEATNNEVYPDNVMVYSCQGALYAFAANELRRAITTSGLLILRAAHSPYQEGFLDLPDWAPLDHSTSAKAAECLTPWNPRLETQSMWRSRNVGVLKFS
jgi:hypothetical protein